MREKQYLPRLTRIARWRLPPGDAADVIEDYTELMTVDFRTYEEHCKDYGTPKYAVRQVSVFWDYARWMITFGVLILFLTLPVLRLFWDQFPYFDFPEPLRTWQDPLLLAVALVISIIWFRWEGLRDKELPDRLSLLLVLLILTGLSVAMLAQALFRGEPLDNFFTTFAPEQRGPLFVVILRVIGGISALLAVAGLVKARLEERRWLALYTAGLTILILTVILFKNVTNMSLDVTAEVWYLSAVWTMGVAAVLGVAGTGVALC